MRFRLILPSTDRYLFKVSTKFVPIAAERYFLICREESLATPFVRQVLATLASRKFRASAAKIPGIDASHAGAVMHVADAFPEIGEVPARPPQPA